MEKTVVIMAAGMGSRYGGLKQLDQVGPSGETIIDYSVYDAIRAGYSKIVFVIRDDFADSFRKKIGSNFEDRIKVDYVFQSLSDIPEKFSVPENRTKPWGTGHAMLTAAPVTSGPFIIINADDFYGSDAFIKTAAYLDTIGEGYLRAALCGFRLVNTLSANGTVSRGVCTVNAQAELVDIEEVHGIRRADDGAMISDTRKDLVENTIVSMNMWAFSASIFSYASEYFRRFLTEHGTELKSEFYIPPIVNTLIREESLKINILKTNTEWYGVTYKEDKPEIVEALTIMTEAGNYPEKLWG